MTAQTKKEALAQVRELIAKYDLKEPELFGKENYVHYKNAEGKDYVSRQFPLWLLDHIKSGKELHSLIVKEDPFMEVQAFFEDKEPVAKA